MTHPLVSVVIRCRNEGTHIGKLLTGIYRQSVRDPEVILVDSGSTDDTLDVAARFPVRVLNIEPAQFSFGRALNLGCDAATGDYIAVASAHVFPLYDDWLAQLLAPFDEPATALSYGRQSGVPASKYAEHRIFSRWFPAQSVARQRHPFCNNANAMIRRSLFRELRYNERLTGLEDLDWAKRAMEWGYRIAYQAGAEVAHVHEESYGQIFNRYRREALALHRIEPDQRLGLFGCLGLCLSSCVSDGVQALRDGTGPRVWPQIAAFRTTQYAGIYNGFRHRGPVSQELKKRFYYPAPVAGSDKPADDRGRIDYGTAREDVA